MNNKKTIFNKSWLYDPEFSSWVEEDTNCKYDARCKVCKQTFKLGNMGRMALVSHAKGLKHKSNVKELVKVKQEMQSMSSYLSKPSSSTSMENIEIMDESQEVVPTPPTFPSQKVKASNSGAISKFGIHDEVLTAEILWAMKVIASHYSTNSSEKTNPLFTRMFPDSTIAQKFKCGKTKCSYLIQFGLSIFFKEDLASKIFQPGTIFVVSFDESLNKVLQEEQMDVYLRFWDSELNKVVSRYFDSVFLGHTQADDLLGKFKECLLKMNMANLLQISMDGPNTNWKFYNTFVEDREKSDPDMPILINIGSCGLHVVHGAFKYGASKTGWKLDGVMRALYHCFNDSPARREDYLTVNGRNALFAFHFCSTRWIEDVPVAERAIKIWPNIKKYVSWTVENLCKSKQPKCQSYLNLREYTKDELILGKLHFFITIAKVLMPFLELFQTDKPMVPFLSEELQIILTNLLQRFIKKSVLEGTSNLSRIDVFKKENIVSPEKVDIGFAAKQVVHTFQKVNKGSKQLKLLEFQMECITFLQEMTGKLIERCPLKYLVVREMIALDPRHIAANPEISVKKMENILQKLLKNKWLIASKCDDILQQFRQWVREIAKEETAQLSTFDRKKDRIDELYFELMGKDKKYMSLWEFVKMLLILSHGQASVERGFSINNDVLKTNMCKETLTAFRIVYDGLQNFNKFPEFRSDKGEDGKLDVSRMPVTKKMLELCRGARNRYEQYLNEEKKRIVNASEEKKKSLKEELTVLKANKRKLELTVDVLLKEADDLAKEAEKKREIDLLVKSNAFREKLKVKNEEIKEAQENIERKEKKLREI